LSPHSKEIWTTVC